MDFSVRATSFTSPPRLAFAGGLLLALAACSQSARFSGDLASGPTTPSTPPITSARVDASISALDIAGFVDSSALARMTDSDRIEATSAQYNILQFGRPGAPRNWNGKTGNSGEISVGPFVRVNLLDCRDFTHTVRVAGQSYRKSGTACRTGDGKWQVETAS
ncbi:MAG TPA: hypothetical protein ENJ68_04800 [Devosia sp.]|nr:hypothetical protein [Devosia sp.]